MYKSKLCFIGLFVSLVILILTISASGQTLPVQYEELTAPDFVRAVAQSGKTCLIPFGILEKHGPHLPLGTDLFTAREIALRAAKKEYAIVFPPYYVGQINEAKHQPGTIAYSERLIWDMMQETCDELARNGLEKIIIVNGHGGNNAFLRYFGQVQLAERRRYAWYVWTPLRDETFEQKIAALRKTKGDDHAGETETAVMLAHRPDLVHLDKATQQSGEDLLRLRHLPDAYTGIWWYAKFPNHYAGDGSPSTRQLGQLILDHEVEQLVEMIRAVKADSMVMKLQQQFFDESEHPLDNRQ